MSLKQILLATLTAIVVFLVSAELLSSLTEPQVQGQINLYQTNLVLQASEWQPFQDQPQAETLLGADPQAEAIRTYSKTIQSLADQPSRTPAQESQLHQAQINLGLLQVIQSPDNSTAQDTWDLVQQAGSSSEQALAQALSQLWRTPPSIAPQAETLFKNHLQGWFQGQAFLRLYQAQNNSQALENLTATIQASAQAAVIRLSLIAVMPLVGSLIGLVLLIFWGINQYRRTEPIAHLQLEIPWSGETTWAVMVSWFGTFFGISFLIMPTLLALVGGRGLVVAPFSQAIYALITYTLMMAAGFGILLYTWRPYQKPVLHWLAFSASQPWWVWSIGAYFVALPLVLLTSLISQQLLQNQGGGNPLLEVILASQDYRSFGILWFMVAVLAPIFEETLFRGFLLPSLLPQMKPSSAIFASGALFAIAHLNAADLLPLAVLGCILGYIYWRTGNLLASMVLHGIWNSGSFLGLLLLSP